MKDTLDLKGTLVPVGREIRAKVGDRLIVVAGICIGVYTGQEGIPVAPPTAQPTGENTSKDTAKRKTWDTEYRSRRMAALRDGTYKPVTTVLPIVEAIRKLFEVRTEYTSQELKNFIGQEHEIGAKEWKIRDAVAYLVYKKELTPHGNSSSRRYTTNKRKEEAA